jgi:hypothetical protein
MIVILSTTRAQLLTNARGIVVTTFYSEFLDPRPCLVAQARVYKVIFGYRRGAEKVWPTITL